MFKREKETSGIPCSGPLRQYVIVSGGFYISPARRKLVFLRAYQSFVITLYPQNKVVSPPLSLNAQQITANVVTPHGGQAGKGCERLGGEALRACVTSRAGSGGSPTGRSTSKGRVGNTGNKNPYFCVCRHLLMHAIDLHCGRHGHGSSLAPGAPAGWCWRTG